MPACCAIDGVGQRSTTHLVFFTRWSCTGRIFFATSFICSGGTSDNSRDVVAAADGDVGVHLLHPREFMDGGQVELPLGGVERELAIDAGVLNLRERDRARFSRRANERDGHFVRHIECFDQDGFVPLQSWSNIRPEVSRVYQSAGHA